MSAKNFKFVSPGVFINEIDNSQLPRVAPPVGPVVIGRFRRGPAFLPTRVESLSELIRIFGEPIRGDEASDVWRGGLSTAPTYGAYAAAAWLKNGAPLTVVRMLGDQDPANSWSSATDDNKTAGWRMGTTPANDRDSGGAYGLFLMNSSSFTAGATGSVNGVLAASWYFDQGGIILSGTIAGTPTTVVSGSGVLIESTTGTAPAQSFTAQIFGSGTVGAGTPTETVTFNFDRNSKYYARKVFNTNPTRTNASLISTDATQKKYFLGETFEQAVSDTISSAKCYGVILPLADSAGLAGGQKFKKAAVVAQTGWFMSQDLRTTAGSATPSNNELIPAFDADNTAICPRLFKFHTLTAGALDQVSYKISVENINYSARADVDPYGSFSVAIRSIYDNDGSTRLVERYDNCNLNPNSANYVARVIGDAYYEWDNSKKRLAEYGTYPNNSSIVRIQMANEVDLGQADPELLPFGAQGPVKRQDFRIEFNSGSATGVFGTGSFLSQTSSWGDSGVDIQYLNVRRKSTDSFKWFDQAAGVAPDDAIVWGGGLVGDAAATVVIAASNAPGDGNQITIRTTDGSSRQFTCTELTTDATQFGRDGSADGIDNLKTAIEASSIASKVTVSSVSTAPFTITITQNVAGAFGNTTVTSNCANWTVAGGSAASDGDFANGTDLNPAPGQGTWLATVKFPDVLLRTNASDGNLSDPTLA
jgi:hypothetical protein